jgi:hypothetical protein
MSRRSWTNRIAFWELIVSPRPAKAIGRCWPGCGRWRPAAHWRGIDRQLWRLSSHLTGRWLPRGADPIKRSQSCSGRFHPSYHLRTAAASSASLASGSSAGTGGRLRQRHRCRRRVSHDPHQGLSSLVGLHGQRRRGKDGKDKDESRAKPAHDYCAGCASERPPAFARTPTPKRSRRSVSDSAPPSAIAAPPSQISVTSGFQ